MNAKKTSIPVTPMKSNFLPVPSIQLVIVCVSLAVALTMAALIIFVDVASPSLADIFLSPKYFPLGQGLQLRSRRWTKSKFECDKHCASNDDNFRRFGGVQCGRAVWKSKEHHGEGDRYVSRIDTLYKLFENSSAAVGYFTNYWTGRLDDSQALPLDHYFDETQISPQAGGNYRAYRWEPVAVSGETEHSKQARHIHYIFVQGRVFARLLVQGFNNSHDQRLAVDFAGRLAGTMAGLIEKHEPSSVRKFLLSVQRGIRYVIRSTPGIFVQKLSTALQLLSCCCSSVLNSTWSSWHRWFLSQLKSLWRHVTGSSIRDLHFLGVAVAVLVVHKVQILLSHYGEMSFSHIKCRSMVTTAVENNRRQQLIGQGFDSEF
ncbi:Hypothetical predicted protein [Paramuricea clavata]|uniref:Uncharacterized protein n=1 Tax=Paramuricea clavata TaxID=317549 RepID=A0A7D9D718_PARCT|nr:Hypothetical predicted protein [Paramuricea clavata]